MKLAEMWQYQDLFFSCLVPSASSPLKERAHTLRSAPTHVEHSRLGCPALSFHAAVQCKIQFLTEAPNLSSNKAVSSFWPTEIQAASGTGAMVCRCCHPSWPKHTLANDFINQIILLDIVFLSKC